MCTRQYKGPGRQGQEKKREQRGEVVSLHNEVGTALQLRNFKRVFCNRGVLSFSDLHLRVICRWDLQILFAHTSLECTCELHFQVHSFHNVSITHVYPQAQLQLIPELFLAHHQAAVTIMNNNSKDTIALSFWQELWKLQKLIITNANPRKEGSMLSLSSSLTGASTYDNIHRSLENFL